MTAHELSISAGPPIRTSLGEKLLDLVASPGEMFEEVAAAPPMAVNWRLPALLVCLTNAILLNSAPLRAQIAVMLQQTVPAQRVLPADAVTLSSNFQLIAVLTACAATFAGIFWSAFLLWFIGRNFLRVHFSFSKSLEVAGLSGSILVLDAIFTFFLTATSGNPILRPSLSALLLGSHSSDQLCAILDVLNPFHLWAVTLLAIGLSKLSGTTFKESAFWVFGYWVLLRLALGLLAG